MMNLSTDDRAVSSARSWLKRILVSWVVLNVLGFIMAYLVPLTSGGQYVLPGGNG
jgi:phosphate/sulfate permease